MGKQIARGRPDQVVDSNSQIKAVQPLVKQQTGWAALVINAVAQPNKVRQVVNQVAQPKSQVLALSQAISNL
jgi:hypothetical protein